MSGLRQQRCRNHEAREAIARCPVCQGFFCRECIVEHDERILCADCLQREAAPSEEPRRRSFAPLGRALAAFLGLVTAWLFFYGVGRVLVATPTRFHEAAIWKSSVEQELQKEDAP